MGKSGQKRPVRCFRVARRFKPIVKSIRYKNSPYTACKAFRVPTFHKALLRQMSKKINQECKSLCSTKDRKSIVRKGSIDDIKNFKWKELSREIHLCAPTLYHALKVACQHQGSRGKNKRHILSMAAAVLLRGRNKFLCVPQTVISTILYTRHCSIRVRNSILQCQKFLFSL